MNDAQIEKLLKLDPDKVQNDAMKTAIVEANRLKKEREAEKVVLFLQQGQDRIDHMVRNLRHLRKQEADAKEALKKFSASFDAFMKDGDVVAFQKAMKEADTEY